MKTEKILFGIFAIIGALIIFGGFKVQESNTEFLEIAQTTMAEITDIDVYHDSDGDSNHTVYVEFNVENKEYSGILNEYNSGMYIGKEVTVYYDPQNPNNFKSSGSKYAGYLVSGFGLIFFLVGAIPLGVMAKKSNNSKKLKETGTLIEAEIDSVYLNRNYTVNGRHPYRLSAHAQLPNSEKIYTFESENVWGNLQAVIDTHKIEKVNVYIDLDNPKKYCVDLDEIKSYIGN